MPIYVKLNGHLRKVASVISKENNNLVNIRVFKKKYQNQIRNVFSILELKEYPFSITFANVDLFEKYRVIQSPQQNFDSIFGETFSLETILDTDNNIVIRNGSRETINTILDPEINSFHPYTPSTSSNSLFEGLSTDEDLTQNYSILFNETFFN